MRKTIVCLLLAAFTGLLIQCSQSEIKPSAGKGMIIGKVTEANTHLSLPYVIIWADGGVVMSDTTDLSGRFLISDMPPGPCVINTYLSGYQEISRTSVYIKADEITEIRIELSAALGLDRIDNPISYRSSLANKR